MPQLDPSSAISPNETILLKDRMRNNENLDTLKKITKTRESIEEEKKNFLKLYLEMLKNQDPSSPMDYSQMANMTLSFQNTSNILDIKELLQTKFQNAETNLVDMAGLIGREVMVVGNELELKTNDDRSKQAEIKYELPKKVAKATLIIRDKSGNIVSEIRDLDTNQGMNTYTWKITQEDQKNDPSLSDYKYNYEIQVEGFNGEEIKATPYCKKVVTEAVKNPDGSIKYQVNSQTLNPSEIFGIASRNILA